MKILITGGTGLLGKSLIETGDRTYEIVATYLGNYDMYDTGQVKYLRLDIRDESSYRKLFTDFKPYVVIHAAGIGSPDYAETHRQEAWDMNVGGTQNIIGNCERLGAKFIYISSNAIYDGKRPPYIETDMPNPINYYGQVKLEGENLTRKMRVSYAIIRPILMYGWNYAFERPNIVTVALSRLKKGESVNVYDDVFCNPLFAEKCAEAVWSIIKREVFSVFNISGQDILSIYDFIKTVATVFGFDSNLIKPVHQGFFKELARRPKDTSYKTTKMENILGIKPLGITEGLEIMKSKAHKDHA